MGNAQEKANLEETLLKFSSPITQTPAFLQIQVSYSTSFTQSFSFPINKSCRSLYLEAVRQAKVQRSPDYKDIIALESNDSNEMIDYWLMKPEFKLDRFALDQPLCLKAVYKPKNHVFAEKKFVLKDFKFLKCIGKGGTSLVSLVRHMKTGHLFAIKQVPKPLLQDPRRLKQIMVERDVLNRLNCPFLADLICAFESENFLNFLMEYYPGGELFFHLKKIKFTEDIARFYFAQIVFALEFLHSQKILYRDLKPENLILDLYGYIRLTDFGLCKRGLEERELTHSFCGSPEYMAPEVINHAGHGYTVDFYTLGALLYEFTTGLPPYYSKNPIEIMENINKGILKIPEKLSEELKDLLKKLLTRNPEERIRDFGCLKQEKWLKDLDWQGVYERKLEAPIQLSLYKSNLHEEFVKIVISGEAMKENPEFRREYPNFEYFSQKYEKFFETPYIYEEDSKKRLASVPANKIQISDDIKNSARKQSLADRGINKIEFSSPKNSKTNRKYCVKIPLKAKAVLAKNSLLLNTTVNGPLNRNFSIANCGHLTNRIIENPEKNKKVTTITIKSKRLKENTNLTNASMVSPKKNNEKNKENKLNIVIKERTLKKPESLEKKKENLIQASTKKVNSEKKISFAGGISKTPVAGKVAKFLGNKTLLLKNWDALKENLNANNYSTNNFENLNKTMKMAKTYKIVQKNANEIKS